MESKNLLVLALDQSTTSTKIQAFTLDGKVQMNNLIEHKQIVPKQNWLEHDPEEIIYFVGHMIRSCLMTLQSSPQIVKAITGKGKCGNLCVYPIIRIKYQILRKPDDLVKTLFVFRLF